MKKREQSENLTWRFLLIEAFFWTQYGVILGFASVYLLSGGFSNSEIGLLIAAAGTISALLQPAVAGYADRPGSLSVKRLSIFFAGAIILCAVILSVTGASSRSAGLFYGACIALLQLMTPFINSLGMESINQGKHLNFGFARGGGSVAYAAGAYLLGILIERRGPSVVPYCIMFVFLGLLAALLAFPFQKTDSAGSAGTGRESRQVEAGNSGLRFFQSYPRFTLVLIGCVLIYISHILLNSFTFQIIESKGGGSAETGFVMALAAVAELPPMFFFALMLKKARCDFWFRISGIFFMLKTLGTLLAPSISSFYAVQIFQMLGWGLITVSSVYYVNTVMKEQDVIKGQAYMTMTYTIGSVLGALIGGRLIDAAGVSAMLLFGTIAASVGMVILLFGTEHTDSRI